MPEEYLQLAFEIKASCDEISRRLLRWHWEQKPGSHTFESLLEHLAQRRQESPIYYDRLPGLGRKTSWQQLDTTLCMRVLLDPEEGAAHPLDLLGNTPHPAAARRACNAVRTARNEAAHAGDRAGGAQAAILFNEAVECLEQGYAGTAFTVRDLEGFYRQAEEYLARAKGEKPSAQTEVNVYPTGKAREQAAAARAKGQSGAKTGSSRKNTANSGARPAASKTASGAEKGKTSAKSSPNSSRRSGTGTSGSHSRGKNAPKGRSAAKKQERKGVNRVVLVIMLLVAAAGLLVRAVQLGLLPR